MMHILEIPQTSGRRRVTTQTPAVTAHQPNRTDLPRVPPALPESVRLAQEAPGPRRDGHAGPVRPSPEVGGAGRERPIIRTDSLLFKTAVENLAKHADLRPAGQLRCSACDIPSPCPSRETAWMVIVCAGQKPPGPVSSSNNGSYAELTM